MDNFNIKLAKLLKARFPYLYISTPEENRVLEMIKKISKEANIIKTPREVYTWTQTKGVMKDGKAVGKGDTKHPLRVLEFIDETDAAAIFVLMDFHVYFGSGGRAPDYQAIRKIRDLVVKLKQNPAPQNVVFVSPTTVLPLELQKDVTMLDFDLPGSEEIKTLLHEMISANTKNGKIQVQMSGADEQKLVTSALGLTLHEAENAYARAMVENGRLDVNDVDTILEEKCQIIKKSEILEYVKSNLTMNDVGGLNNLKKWLEKRDKSWLEEARRYNLPAPKGILVAGVPGCGKSLCAKAMSAMWQLPLLRLDIGKVFSGIVGSSEENIRRALQTAEAVAPSILWIDEIEKGFGGATSSSSGDSGTSSRVFGTFLTWMQEKTKPVFVMATANNIKTLPPEFMRKGRFDEIFFVDLPTKKERRSILKVHMDRCLKDPSVTKDLHLNPETFSEIIDRTEGFSGAEIEQVVISALFEAFSERRSLQVDDIFKAITNMVPLSVTQAEEILMIREWANVRAVSATSVEDRTEYSSNKEPDGKGEADGEKEMKNDVLSCRGGRAVDF